MSAWRKSILARRSCAPHDQDRGAGARGMSAALQTEAGPSLVLENIQAGYGDFQALFGVSLRVAPGEAVGVVEVCAAVAGVYPDEDVPVHELDLPRFERTIAQNLTATFLTARAFLRGLAERESGALVLVGSTAGRFGEAGHADYAAAKSAIQVGLLLSLKNEAARIGPRVRVNAVAPGWTLSPMTRGLLEPDDVRRITRTMPLRKVAQPEDVAAQVVTLASERLSGHVTGELVTVAGGMEGRMLHAD